MVRAKFSPIGDELSPEVAWVQAAMALDVAGMLAQKKEDVRGMCEVAALYADLGSRMMGDGPIGEAPEVDEEAEAKKAPLGFSPCPVVIPVEEADNERTDKDGN